jgi:hypothetical protein
MTKNVFHKCVGFILFCSDYSERSSYTKLLIDILDELLDLGLLGFFQIERKGSFISTDFNSMGRERFVQMFKNLLCNTVTVKGSSFLIKNKNKPIHSTEDLYQKIYGKSDIKFWKTRMRFDGLDMVIEMKNSKNRLIRPSSSKMVVKLCSDEEYRRTCSDDPDDID